MNDAALMQEICGIDEALEYNVTSYSGKCESRY